jgi:succinate dehydrogenase flavin-adding protein (antitoxin of CptAB toxin-antitoxin module)
MLELDLMLQTFLDHDYEKNSDETKQAFIELLTFSDQDLLELLLAKEQADSPHIADVIRKIRHATLAHA